jgi:hypothetical protein
MHLLGRLGLISQMRQVQLVEAADSPSSARHCGQVTQY